MANKKIEKVLTLSSYEDGSHKTSGKYNANVNLSFAESLVPLKRMITSFEGIPLGTKIKVTMKVVK